MANDRDYSLFVARLLAKDAEGCCGPPPDLCDYHKGYGMGVASAMVHLSHLKALDPEVDL